MKILWFILPAFMFFMDSSLLFAQKDKETPVIYQVDTAASVVQWWCDLHRGYIMLEKGTLSLNKDKLTGGEFDICMESITDTDIDYELMRTTLENTLKSKDFLNTAKYHFANFVIDDVIYRNDSALITGDLTFLGVTKCISFSAMVTVKKDSVFATTEKITIDRTDFGNTTMSEKDAKSDKSFIVPDEVFIVIHLKGYILP